MVSAISNVSPYAAVNSAVLSGAASAPNNAASTSTTDQEALLEAELGIYTQQLAEASEGDSSNVPGVTSTQQIQEQIASIQQQIDQLDGGAYTSTSGVFLSGNLINTFA